MKREKKSTFSRCTELLQTGPPSLYLTAAAAYKLLEANPVTKLAFPNGKNRRWQTVTYSQAHTPTKHPVSNFFFFFFRKTLSTQAGKIVTLLIRMQTFTLKSNHTNKCQLEMSPALLISTGYFHNSEKQTSKKNKKKPVLGRWWISWMLVKPWLLLKYLARLESLERKRFKDFSVWSRETWMESPPCKTSYCLYEVSQN